MRYLSSLLLAVVSLIAAGCDSVPLTAPTESTITITSDRSVLPLNGTATLRAVVVESGGTMVHNGTVVTFAPTLGSVTPVEVETVNGVATAVFNAGSVSGKSVINAFSGGVATSTAAEITIGSAAASTIALSATPSSVSQSGGTVTVSALVMDASGNPLPGVNVTFSADTGQLSAVSALSDATGTARTQLTTTQTSKVTATAGAATKDVTVTVTAAPTVTITALETGTVGVPVAITVSTAPANGTARQVQTLVVDFGDGSSETRSNVTGTIGFTHTYNSARGFTITATAVDVAGNTGVASKAIVIARQQLPTASISAPATTTVAAPIAVTFSGSATAPAQVVSAKVTLQDGTVIYSGSSANNFNYKFSGAGTYTLTGTVTDSNGNTATASTNVFVTP
jgi:adhesin/invasin